MEKSSIIHTRVSPEIKAECEEIFNKLGITTSYAISLFLNQVSLKGGIPFSVTLPKKQDKNNEIDEAVNFAIGISTSDANEPSEKAKKLLKLLAANVIDLETYEFAIKRMYTNG